MMARVVGIGLCLGAAAAAAGGLFWVFLNTPESNAWMLAASALLLILVVAVVAAGVNAAVLVAARVSFGEALARSLRGLHWFAIAGLLALAAAWAIGRVSGWFGDTSGEISAWFIATFGWSDVTSLFTAISWAERWLLWVVLPVGVIGVVGGALSRRPGASALEGLARAWHWRSVAMATIIVATFVWLPWQLTAWRPALPDTWVQIAVAAARLGAAALLMILGAALLVLLVGPQADAIPQASNQESSGVEPR